MKDRTLEHLYVSTRDNLFRVVVDPKTKRTHLERTSWPEEHKREKLAKEA